MVASAIAMLVSHETTTKGGGLPWITFLIYALPFEIYGLKREGHPGMEKGINMTFNNLI